MSPVKISGTVAPGFEPVREQFEAHFTAGKERNAQCCVYVGKDKVVDLYGTAVGDDDYGPDSLQTVFSSGKSVEVFAMAHLVDKGKVEYGDLVTRHWPEFGQNGKGAVKIEDVLRHESGLPFFGETIKMSDLLTENIKRNSVGALIERQELVFPPPPFEGRRDYHAITRGFLLNEIFRRADPSGLTIGEYLRKDLSDKVGGADVFVGLPDSEKSRIWDLEGRSTKDTVLSTMCPEFLGRRAESSAWELWTTLSNRPKRKTPDAVEGLDLKQDMKNIISSFNYAGYRAGEMSSATSSCSARGLALIGTAMANGGVAANGERVFSEETVKKVHSEETEAKDYGLGGKTTKFTQGGVCHFDSSSKHRHGYYGWMGLGGSCFQWHPELNISFAYAQNLIMWEDPICKKAGRLQNVVLKCVEKK